MKRVHCGTHACNQALEIFYGGELRGEGYWGIEIVVGLESWVLNQERIKWNE